MRAEATDAPRPHLARSEYLKQRLLDAYHVPSPGQQKGKGPVRVQTWNAAFNHSRQLPHASPALGARG